MGEPQPFLPPDALARGVATYGSGQRFERLGRKLLENWLVWLVVNLISVGLFAYKGLWLTVGLYAVFIALSVAGWRAWRRQLQARPAD